MAFSRISRGIPVPVSSTSTWIQSLSMFPVRSVRAPPSGMASMALTHRFMKAWVRAAASPRIGRSSSARSRSRRTLPRVVRSSMVTSSRRTALMSSTRSSTGLWRAKLSRLRTILPPRVAAWVMVSSSPTDNPASASRMPRSMRRSANGFDRVSSASAAALIASRSSPAMAVSKSARPLSMAARSSSARTRSVMSLITPKTTPRAASYSAIEWMWRSSPLSGRRMRNLTL